MEKFSNEVWVFVEQFYDIDHVVSEGIDRDSGKSISRSGRKRKKKKVPGTRFTRMSAFHPTGARDQTSA